MRTRVFSWENMVGAGLVTGSLINVFVASFMVSRFRDLYRDALPGQILPPSTAFFLANQPLMVCLGLLWPALGFGAFFLLKSHIKVAVIVACLVAAALQFGCSIVALFSPMGVIITGMHTN